MSAPAPASDFDTIIGLEIHAQLRTRSKMFCGCEVQFGALPNTLVCPVCLGLPGALPVVNSKAVHLAVRAALALGCEVHSRSAFARKNYFYPDLPKGYQITQYDQPLSTNGHLELPVDEARATLLRVRIRRIHLEEDAGKSLHDRFADETAVDLNRAGVPLIEIVTEPDLRSPSQARAFLSRLKQTLEYLEVSDCNMEEGSLRIDANVSIRVAGNSELGTKTEVKNMNSFSQLEKALAFEAARHLELVRSGSAVVHQTMLWDAARGEARPMRAKEEIHDYRYFPEPDLPTLEVLDRSLETAQAEIPELPWEKERRFTRDYGLPVYDARVLSASRSVADFYEELVPKVEDPKSASNWVMGEVLAACNDLGLTIRELKLTPNGLAELILLVKDGTLTGGLAKRVLRKMVETGKSAKQIAEEENLSTVSDETQLESWVSAVIEEHPDEVRRYLGGEAKLLSFFIGQVMRKSQGRADPEQLRRVLERALGNGQSPSE